MIPFERRHGRIGVGAQAAVLLIGSIGAQQFAVVPAGWESQDGNSRASVAGILESGREQILVGPSHLQALAGRLITALEFRRTKGADVFQGGSSTLSVTISVAPHSPLAASSVFSENQGPAPVLAFSGSVLVPTSPACPGPNVAWSPENVVRIPLQTPFLYSGGTLCIDIAGVAQQGVSSPWWVADAVEQLSDATLTHLGPGTGPFSDPQGRWSQVDVANACAGGDSVMIAHGANPSIMLGVIGRPAAAPIPLNVLGLGAPGATAYVDEVYLSYFTVMTAPPVPGVALGVSVWKVDLPNQSWVLGAELATQWLDIATWDVSNGIKWTVSSIPPSLDMAHVEGRLTDPDGDRSIVVAPILRFEYTTP